MWLLIAFVRARVTAADRLLWTPWAAGWGIVYAVYFAVMGW